MRLKLYSTSNSKQYKQVYNATILFDGSTIQPPAMFVDRRSMTDNDYTHTILTN